MEAVYASETSVRTHQIMRCLKPKHHNINYSGDVNPLKSSGHYMYRQFNINQFYVLPTQCIYVFCVDLRTNSDYFTVQH
jgi:hypothetical protein